MKKIKSFDKVEIGEMAFENPDAGGEWNNEEGIVLWKGTYSELMNSKYEKLSQDWEGMEPEDFEEYNLIVIDLEPYGATLYNYNNDPSGCVVFE